MKFLDKVRGFFTGGKERDEHTDDTGVQVEPDPVKRKPKIEQPTCGIYPHKNRRYDGTLRGSMDATKLGGDSWKL